MVSKKWLAALALAAALTACGGGEETPDAGGTEPVDDAISAQPTEYCDLTLAIETIPEPDIDFASMSRKEQAAAAKSFAAGSLLPLADKIWAAAPKEVAPEIDVLYNAVREVAKTGNFGVFETREVEKASNRASAFNRAHCGWNTAGVTAVDYGFKGLESKYPAGPISFEFTNDGKEFHEMVVIRKNDDTTESFDELLELPQKQAMAKTTVVASTFEAPGEGGYVVADLTPGEYIVLCFIPEGSTPQAKRGGGGPPHFTMGMRAEFTAE